MPTKRWKDTERSVAKTYVHHRDGDPTNNEIENLVILASSGSIFCGIDPGVSGGLAFISEKEISAYPMPRTETDIAHLLMEDPARPLFAVIEFVHSFPGQGVSSTFKFGKNYGLLRGIMIAAGIPFEEVSPVTWQRKMACLSKGDKNITKARAQQLFPKLKITHATADALLIAEYARRTYSNFKNYPKEPDDLDLSLI